MLLSSVHSTPDGRSVADGFQTLPIGYYPTLSDASLDRILLDESQYTVEWMATTAEYARALDFDALIGSNNHVSMS